MIVHCFNTCLQRVLEDVPDRHESDIFTLLKKLFVYLIPIYLLYTTIIIFINSPQPTQSYTRNRTVLLRLNFLIFEYKTFGSL